MKIALIAVVSAAVFLGACRSQYSYTPVADECHVYNVCEDEKFYK